MKDFFYDLIADNGVQFDSNAIETVAYNREHKQLYVGFQSGGEYVYDDVNESTYNLFVASDSLGRFWRDHISGNYTSTKDVYFLDTKDAFEDVVVASDDSDYTDPVEPTPNDDAYSIYGIKWTLDGTEIVAEPDFHATSEDHALEQFYTAIEALQKLDLESFRGKNVEVLAVTHYFA